MHKYLAASTSLTALARSLRIQRANEHAQVHRMQSTQALRHSLGFMTGTACVAEETSGWAHRMEVLGVSPVEGVAYVVEHRDGFSGASGQSSTAGSPLPDALNVYRLALTGPRLGHLVPVLAWLDRDVKEVRSRLDALAPTLEPVSRANPESWMLSTRVIQRRALRRSGGADATQLIRKFALQLVIEPVTGYGPGGTTTVTAFLRPHAQITQAWWLPHGGGLVRVTYTGVPNGLGHTMDTVVLVT